MTRPLYNLFLKINLHALWLRHYIPIYKIILIRIFECCVSGSANSITPFLRDCFFKKSRGERKQVEFHTPSSAIAKFFFFIKIQFSTRFDHLRMKIADIFLPIIGRWPGKISNSKTCAIRPCSRYFFVSNNSFAVSIRTCQ